MAEERSTEIQKVFPREDHTATIVCPYCQRSKEVDISPFIQKKGPLNVKCPCGKPFSIFIELRKYFRKKALLSGTFTSLTSSQRGAINVTDLSCSGIGFETLLSHELVVQDILRVTFELDDDSRTRISRLVTIIRVSGKKVGAAFADHDPPNAFNFYIRL